MTSGDLYVEAAAWSQIVASVLFMAVLVWLWIRFIMPAIMTAQANANRLIAEAERHRDEAKATLERLGGEVDAAKRDAEAIVSRAQGQAQHEYDAIVAEAEESGQRALANANGEFDRSMASARLQLRDEFADKALALARVEAERRVDAALNAVLVDKFIAGLERAN